MTIPRQARDRADRHRRLPWTCDPALRWETGQAGACLAAPELAAHIRQLRRQGWQSWEIRARFDYGEAA